MNRAAEIRFPEEFPWGAATAAYQVEGRNLASGVLASHDHGRRQEQDAQATPAACQGPEVMSIRL